MSIVATVPAFVLNNEALLVQSLECGVRDLARVFDRGNVRQKMLLDYHHWNRGYPDQVPVGLWNQYSERKNKPDAKKERRSIASDSLVLEALDCLYEEYLEEINGETYVQMDEFGWWQNMLSHLSPLPLQAYAQIHGERRGRMHLHPYEPSIEGYIRQRGLNDCHLHLKLCATAEMCWLGAMGEPDVACDSLKETLQHRRTVSELLGQVHPQLTPEVLHNHLLVARAIRLSLILWAYAPEESPPLAMIIHGKPLQNWRQEDFRNIPPPEEAQRLILPSPRNTTSGEKQWMAKFLLKLKEDSAPEWDHLLHVYLLLLHEHRNFYTQSENCVGFSQFQKSASFFRPNIGDVDYYAESFLHLHGRHRDSTVEYVNARIAPKDTSLELENEIGTVLTGYLAYLKKLNRVFGNNPTPPDPENPLPMGELTKALDDEIKRLPQGLRTVKPDLTLHFIKQRYELPECSTQDRGCPHYHEIRERYKRQCRVMTELLQKVPSLKHWLRAVDAAGSELDTPPYVFAPVFRAARDVAGIPHQVYHAGEDFPHLVSGIRAVFETVSLLGMKQGDRVGHATALGIAPGLWLQSLPNAISLKVGDWLQDLVFAWNVLSTRQDCAAVVAKLDRDIRSHASRIFQHAKHSPHSISQVMELRALDPCIFHQVRLAAKDNLQADDREKPRHVYCEARKLHAGNFHLLPPEARELRIVMGAIDNMPDDVLDMAYLWHYSADVWKQRQEHVTINTDYFRENELLILQQTAAEFVRQRGIVLETLPTSNIRISQYKEMRQHHVLRWLGVDPYAQPGDLPITVILGDDDPGVFCTNIKNEFYHLFMCLKRSGLNSGDAMRKIMEINECGFRYAFRPLNHTSPNPNFPCSDEKDSWLDYA